MKGIYILHSWPTSPYASTEQHTAEQRGRWWQEKRRRCTAARRMREVPREVESERVCVARCGVCAVTCTAAKRMREVESERVLLSTTKSCSK